MSDFSSEAMATCRKHGRFSTDDSYICPSCPDPQEDREEIACDCGSKDCLLCGDCEIKVKP